MNFQELTRITESVEKDFSLHSKEKNKLFRRNYVFNSPFGGKKNLTIERHPRKSNWTVENGVKKPKNGPDLDSLILNSLYEKD